MIKMSLLPIRKRSAERFLELANPEVKLLYNAALRYTGKTNDAEDLVQETLYTGFKNFHQLRDESKIKSWLFTILRNKYLKSVRRGGQINEAEYDDSIDYLVSLEAAVEHTDPEKLYQMKTESEQIQKALAKLPEKYKSPLLLYYLQDLSYQKISDALEIPIGTVMSRLSRGKQILKKEILRISLKSPLPENVVNLQQLVHKG